MDVSYNDLAKAMAMSAGKGGMYDGALDAQSKTMAGKWSTIKDKATNALTDIGDAFAPVIMKVLDVGIGMVDKIQPMLEFLKPYIDYLSTGLSMAIDYVIGLGDNTGVWGDWLDIASTYVGNLWTGLKGVLKSVWSIVSGIIAWIAKSELIKDVFRLCAWFMGKVWELVGWIGEKLLWLWDNVLKPLLYALDDAYKWVKDLMGDEVKVTKTLEIKTLPMPPDAPKADAPTDFTSLTRFNGKGGIAAADDDKKKNKKAEKQAKESVSSGGPKTVNISLGKFFENIQFTTLNASESAVELEKTVLECLGRVLYNGAKMV
jgi:hypothetical protein